MWSRTDDMSDAGMSCGEAVIQSLTCHGVDTVFGIPGTHNLPLYDHLVSHGLRHVTPRHEQGAGYAADGYARATGKPGIYLVTTGPGVTNIATAAATAYHDSVPLLIISPGMPADREGRDTGYLHEVKAQSRAMESLVHRSNRVSSADEALEAVAEAFRHFGTERPRPVHIEIPLDILSSGISTVSMPVYLPSPPQAPDPHQLAAAVHVLERAHQPGIILGGGAVNATDQAVALAERLDAIVVTTCAGKGTISERHPQSLGCSIRFAAAREALADCDVVMAVGTEIAESDLWVPRLDFQGKLVRVDIEPAQLHKNAHADAPILGDAGAVLGALLTELPSSPGIYVSGRRRVEEIRCRLKEESQGEKARFEQLHAILTESLDGNAIIAGDSSQVSYLGTAHLFSVDRPRRFLYPVGYATLGYGIPAAIGAKVGHPDRQVVALVGDGAAMFSIAEVATAAQMRVPLPIIVVNNGGYAEIRKGMRLRGSPLVGVDLDTPDFAALGRSLGGEGVLLDNVEELNPALRQALCRDRPTIIELRVED